MSITQAAAALMPKPYLDVDSLTLDQVVDCLDQLDRRVQTLTAMLRTESQRLAEATTPQACAVKNAHGRVHSEYRLRAVRNSLEANLKARLPLVAARSEKSSSQLS